MREDAITVSLDLEGFRVVETKEREDRVEAVIETVVSAGCCPRCGHGTLQGKGRRDRVLRDLPVRDRPVYLRWRRRAFRCRACGHRFVERHEAIPDRVRAMARFEQYLYERTRPGLVPLSHVARTEHVSFYRTQTAHTRGAHGELEGRPPPRLRAVSVDEASFKKRQDYNTTICAPELGRAIELVRGRDGVGFAVWAGMLPLPVRRGVEVFCADMWEPYHEVAAAAFPKALRVADRFHVQRHANRALDDVRRELQHGPGRGWRKDLFGSRWALLRAKEDLTARDHDRLAALFARYPDLELAWRLKEDLRDFYRDSDQGSAGPALIAWCQRAEASGLPSYAKLAATIRQWKPEILGYFHDRVTNAFAEGVTNKIKCIKRIGFGYRNFERFRERVLVA